MPFAYDDINEGKRYVHNYFFQELEENGAVIGISKEKADLIFNEMYKRILISNVEGSDSRIDFFNRP